MRLLPLDFRDQYFGCEIELTGINRATAAQTLADLFGTRAEHSGGGYDAYRVKDLDGKEWKIVRDASIHPEGYVRSSTSGEYKVELNSPKLEYAEMEKLQEVVRALRRAGGKVNSSCGMHVHVDASKHTPQSLKNVLSIMYSKEDILFAALKVNPARIDSYCQAVDEPILEEIRKLPSGASMDQLKDRWYQGRDGSDYHYHSSRYRACNMHSVFYHGTIEWRLFNSTLHAGEVKANIILAMAISAQGINQKYTQFRKTPIARKILYESAEYHNCVFLGKDPQGVPKYAALRGIYNYGKPFKREAPGSQKQYGFCIPPMQPGTTVSVFEAAIDAMAEMTLCGDAADKYRLSLGGVSSSGKEPLALQEFLRQHPEITTIELRLDNDAKGRMASVGIRKIYADRYTVHDLPPNIENGDYADMAKNNLMARTAAHCAGACR